MKSNVLAYIGFTIPLMLIIPFICIFNATSITYSITSIEAKPQTIVIEKAYIVHVEGSLSTIDYPLQQYIVDEAIPIAENEKATLIVVLDTYGGYVDPAIAIANAFIDAKIPIIVFVKDKAMSAGSMIALAATLLVMKPHAIIGAAQPVTINPVTGEVEFINESKIVNFVVQTMKRYAEIRNRNVTAAELFVKKNLVLEGIEAVKYGVADFTVDSIDTLLIKLKGTTVCSNNVCFKLNITDIKELPPSLRVTVYSILRDPIMNSILVLFGVFGTLFAIFSGRFEILPLTIVLLILAMISSGSNVNVLAIVLLVLGASLLFVELFLTPGFGILGISGIIALVFGILLMPLRPGSPTFSTYVEHVRTFSLYTAIGLGSFFGFIMYKALAVRRRKMTISYTPERLYGRAIDRIEPGKEGYVLIHGEYWKAESDEVIEAGETVVVVGREGLKLKVRKLKK